MKSGLLSLLCPTLLLIPFFAVVAAASSAPPNLLRNPGFEESEGWLAGWTVEDLNHNGPPYHYRLDDRGTGHGDARPRTGQNAIEVYGDGARRTILWQTVELEPGRYRLAAWGRSNGNSDLCRLQLRLGEQSVTVPAIAERYRFYYADFEVERPGSYQAGFHSVSLGAALDDLSLVRLPANGAPEAPYLYLDLCPTSPVRSNGTQTFFRGQRQWVNCTVSCTDPSRLRRPILRLEAPEEVRVTGFNEEVLRLWAYPGSTDTPVREEKIEGRDGPSRQFVVALPRFISGPGAPVGFGGFWIEVPNGRPAVLRAFLEDDGRPVSEEVIRLEPVDPPRRIIAPKRYRVVAYCVQGWTMSLPERLEVLPQQFAQMGMNVWSDYGLVPPPEQPEPGREEQVRARAFEEGCVREFWGNHSNLLETTGYVRKLEELGLPEEGGMFQVGADGQVHRGHFSLRYAAQGGPAWLATAMHGHTYAVRRPQEIGLPYRYTGFITDGLEGIPVSFDSLTLADFARAKGIDRDAVTVAALQGELALPWASYNMRLYAEVAHRWAEALKEVDPEQLAVNTLGSFGPAGAGALPLTEQMEWARGFDYTMPQWYATNFYGDAYYAILQQGLAQKVYGKENGYADVIPLLNQTMGAGINDPEAVRFHLFDLVSASPVVKGVGYFIATNIFADARLMAEMAAVHALLAEVEEYYALGAKADSLATFQPTGPPPPRQRGIDLEGLDAEFVPEVHTTVRVHRLDEGNRLALLTVVSHCNQGIGERGTITLDLAGLVGDPRGKTVVDRLTGRRHPLSAEVQVDTRKSHSLALLEIVEE
ncbi:MAG: hypothetical protein WDA75_04365 [Candidatus Latescibacterota bacterium]|jgi:hypothetical protein